MTRVALAVCVGVVMSAVAPPSWAWGPKTRVAVVATAAKLLTKQAGVPLANLEKDIRDGASLSPTELEAIMPLANANPVGAIESEMYLLQAVRGKRVDPYYAYRLGALGSLVARATAPMADANPTYRNLYYADVEERIERAQLQAAPRTQVDPTSYFADVLTAAREHDDILINDYRSGIGIKGIAGQALSEDTSRSVNAVADVYMAVLSERVTVANISQSQIRDFCLDSIDFYIKRGNDTETDSAYANLMTLGVTDSNLLKQIGDMFYDAERFERAMAEYKRVLELEPGRRDVVERIAVYYVRVGDEALEDSALELAAESYQAALDADLLHPTAQQKLIEAQNLIQARDTRMDDQRQAIARADDLVKQAEQQAFKRSYGEAMGLLQQARTLYESVTDEFADERRAASSGLFTVGARLNEMQRDMLNNAPSLSGLGSGLVARKQAEEASQSLDNAALRRLIENALSSELERLKSESVSSSAQP